MQFSLKRHRIFRNSFRYPLGDPPRTAVLADWFHSHKFRFDGKNSVRVFANALEAAQFSPEALAATREQLLSINPATLPTLTRAVIALARPGAKLLTAAERDRLWRAFKVPVFEQIIGLRGELLAAECEAHDGLHVNDPEWNADEEAYCVDCSSCACGSKLPRLSSPELMERVRAVAAYAR